MFPLPEAHSQNEAQDREKRARFNPDAATVRKNLDDVRNELQQSSLGRTLQNVFVPRSRFASSRRLLHSELVPFVLRTNQYITSPKHIEIDMQFY
jgi:hypothetical protein